MPVDRGMRRQSTGVFQYFRERPVIVPNERNSIGKRRELSAHFSRPELFIGRLSDHHGYRFGVGQYAQDILDDGRKIVRDRNDGIIVRETGRLNSTLLHGGKHHGSRGKELLPAPLHEGCRGSTEAHNQIGRAPDEQSPEVFDKRALRILIVGKRARKRVFKELHLPWRLPIEFRANGLGVFAPRFEIAAEGMKQQHPLGVSRQGRRTGKRCSQKSRGYCETVSPRGHTLRTG